MMCYVGMEVFEIDTSFIVYLSLEICERIESSLHLLLRLLLPELYLNRLSSSGGISGCSCRSGGYDGHVFVGIGSTRGGAGGS